MIVDFQEDRFRFLGDAVSGTALKGETSTIAFKLEEDSCTLSGVDLGITGWVPGDFLSFSVVDIDNVLGQGAGHVLATYTKKWFVTNNDMRVFSGCMSPVFPLGVYLCLTYTSVGTQDDVKVVANFYLHKKLR